VLGARYFNDSDAASASVGGTTTAAGTGATAGTGAATGVGLAFTGAGVLVLLVTALLAMAVGYVLWRSARQRSAPSDL